MGALLYIKIFTYVIDLSATSKLEFYSFYKYLVIFINRIVFVRIIVSI